ncbi:MAG: hypothetical protein JWL72_3467 [Ilumatobacteraceae bacterium]|nr:hypothetical protein [Ilumatobacteraceae bacterium]
MSRFVRYVVAGALALTAVGCSSDNGAGPVTTTATTKATTPSSVPASIGSNGTNTTEAPATVQPSDPTAPSAPASGGAVINVPADQPTIQKAVDAAAPGDLILIQPGTYKEAVNVETNDLTIRGIDRNTTILDGGFALDNGIRVVGANGVAIENLTARNFTKNGFFWTGVTGYRGSYLTAFRNGDYGIYAFLSYKGQLDHSYGGGSPDAGFYIGGCYPCDAVVDHVISEHNGLGYSGTNSGGDLYILNSTFRFNRAGVVPNSGSYELCYPERSTTIIGNTVYSNNQPDTPAIDVALLAMGNGILSAGGVGNDIERNLVYDHDKTGIGLVPYLEQDPNDDQPSSDSWNRPCADTVNDPLPDPASVPASVLWDSHQNVVKDNTLADNRIADIAVDSAGTDLATLGNSFCGNSFTTSAPLQLEALAPCDGAKPSATDWTAGVLNVVGWLGETHPPSQDYTTSSPEPPAQDNMPDAATAPAHPATDVPAAVDTDSITVPAKPGS